MGIERKTEEDWGYWTELNWIDAIMGCDCYKYDYSDLELLLFEPFKQMSEWMSFNEFKLPQSVITNIINEMVLRELFNSALF